MTNKEVSERIYKVLKLWDCLSENPDDYSCMTDHCHIEYSDVEEIAFILADKKGDF